MARYGVQYKEVADAAAEITGQGKNPTVESVRILVGTGSSTTIANHLRQWKSNQESTSATSTKENIPSELVAMTKGLWERLMDHSQEKVSAIEHGYQKTIFELQLELEKYKANNQRWQKLYNQWNTKRDNLTQDKLQLEQALESSQQENTSLQAKQDLLLQQLKEKEEKINKYIESQSDNKVLSQQLSHIKQSLIDAENTNKLLAQEKWELNQEKALLEVQLKQMQ